MVTIKLYIATSTAKKKKKIVTTLNQNHNFSMETIKLFIAIPTEKNTQLYIYYQPE